jgi:hypothetical protein
LIVETMTPLGEEGLVKGPMAIPGVRGTLWAAYNGVTECVDHHHRAMNTTDGGRLNSIWFGSGYLVEARAFDAAKGVLAQANLN